VGTSLYRTSLVVVASALGVLFASAAAADIYTWTDERGTTVISDTPPANAKRVTDLQVVVRDNERRSGKRAGAREATQTEQKLLDRIDNLERQVRAQSQAQTYSSPPAAAPAPPPAVSYYTAPPAPPAYDPYYSDYYSGYYPNYYPSYYGASYPYFFPGTVVIGRSFIGHRGHGHFARRPVAAPVRGGAFAGRGRR
jgi:hypothetical protein